MCRSFFLLLCGTIVPAKQRNAIYVKVLLTRRSEQLQQGNICDSGLDHAGTAKPAEFKFDMEPEDRKKQRQMAVKPLIEAFFVWVKEVQSSQRENTGRNQLLYQSGRGTESIPE